MNRWNFALFGIIALANVAQIHAKPMKSCSDQMDCIDITAEPICDGPCDAPCEFKICLTIDQGGKCVKSGSISHTCIKDDEKCMGDNHGFKNAVETASIGNGHQQCQYARAGEDVQFLLKDGQGCKGLGRASKTFGNVQAKCRPRPKNLKSCTGNGAGKECIWIVKVPEDEPCSCGAQAARIVVPDPTPEPTKAPTPEPTSKPTKAPTPEPTAEPTSKPTKAPTPGPTAEPTKPPTAEPTKFPTPGPTKPPTPGPTAEPTKPPTPGPTRPPSPGPTYPPTGAPTDAPTMPGYHDEQGCAVDLEKRQLANGKVEFITTQTCTECNCPP